MCPEVVQCIEFDNFYFTVESVLVIAAIEWDGGIFISVTVCLLVQYLYHIIIVVHFCQWDYFQNSIFACLNVFTIMIHLCSTVGVPQYINSTYIRSLA